MASQVLALLTSRSSLVNAVAGSTGAMVSIAAVYPLIVLRTKLAMSAKKKKKKKTESHPAPGSGPGLPTQRPTADAGHAQQQQQQQQPQLQQQQQQSLGARLADALRAVLSLYNGLPVALAEGGVQKFVYFYSFAILSKAQAALTGRARMGTLVNLVVGYLAALSTILFSLPLESVSTKLQVDPHCTIASAVARTVADLPHLLRGVLPSVLLCVNPAIQFTVYERFKGVLVRALLRRQLRAAANDVHGEMVSASLAMEGRAQLAAVELSTAQSFWLGAASKAVATLLTLPLLTAKLLALSDHSHQADTVQTSGKSKKESRLGGKRDLATASGNGSSGGSSRTSPPDAEHKKSIDGRRRSGSGGSDAPGHTGNGRPGGGGGGGGGGSCGSGSSCSSAGAAETEAAPAHRTSVRDVLLRRWREKGLAGFYRGVVPQLTKGMVGSAIMMAIKEKIYAAIFALLLQHDHEGGARR